MQIEIEEIRPEQIEAKSFSIIEQELKQKQIVLDAQNEMVIKRAIHTTADFDYAKTLCFSVEAVRIAKDLLLQGADIVTDTNMTLAGINKRVLKKYGGEVHCFMADEEVAKIAKERGVTRASISMERARAIRKPVLYAIGNAPTALITLYEGMEQGIYMPSFVIGVPVGFVNVEAAKELIISSKVPYIINRGRKGGSNVAAALVNAILYELSR
ncbi:MAG: precorrin-8X/cobalt-precorrin-8 methylmutase [Clostridiales bacterium]|nr:precorrin-8X/cobalt-precorrin-8 methylmutase [Clostridiales bacterium]